MCSSTRPNSARPIRSLGHVPMKGSADLPTASTNSSRWSLTRDLRAGNAMASGRMGAAPMALDASSAMRRSDGKTMQSYWDWKRHAARLTWDHQSSWGCSTDILFIPHFFDFSNLRSINWLPDIPRTSYRNQERKLKIFRAKICLKKLLGQTL